MPRTFLVLAVLACATLAHAQSTTDPHGVDSNHGVVVGDKLEPGANSFTEAQVRNRFEEMGFGAVTDLRKDDRGIWRGTAQHAGKTLAIGMDFKGHVAAE